MATRSKDKRQVPAIYIAGAVLAAAGVMSTPRAALAQSLDTVLQRLEKLERSNAKLQEENAALRASVGRVETSKGGAAAPAASGGGSPKGNPVLHGAVATSPAPAPTLNVAGMPVKAGPIAPLIDNTTVTIYGHVDVSGDLFN